MLHGALMLLHVPWTEALTGFSWESVQRTGLAETDRVSPGAKDRRLLLVWRCRFLKLTAPLPERKPLGMQCHLAPYLTFETGAQETIAKNKK